MSEASAAHPAPAPWSFAVFAAVPLPPLCVGMGVSAALLAVYFGVEYATGQIGRVLAGTAEAHIPGHFRIAVTNALLIGYLPTAQIYLARWSRRNREELRPLLRAGPSRTTGALESPSLSSPASRLAGAAGALFMPLLFVVLFASDPSALLSWNYWVFDHVWANLMAIAMGWLMGRFFHAIVADSRQISRFAGELASIDLLDLTALQPFVRQGLWSALLAIVFISIGSAHTGNILIPVSAMAVSVGLMLAAAVAALVLPLRGVHRRIRQEKGARLTELRRAIRARERDLLEGGTGSARASAELPGLLALEARIGAVREWPLDGSNLLRFALYVALGMGSWLGAAAVERLLDRVLA